MHLVNLAALTSILLPTRELSDEPPLAIDCPTRQIGQYERAEMRIHTGDSIRSSNAFDPAEFDLGIDVTTPGGTVLRIPAFFCQEYERKERRGDRDRRVWLYPVGTGVWKARFTPTEVGTHTIIARSVSPHGVMVSSQVTVRCVPSQQKGFVRVSKSDRRYFEFTNGQPFFPIGQNLAFIGASQHVRFDNVEDFFEKLASNGANYLRIWTCCHDWALAIEAPQSGWTRSWTSDSPVVPVPDGPPGSAERCVALAARRDAPCRFSPCHPVAVRPSTAYALRGALRRDGNPSVRVAFTGYDNDVSLSESAGQQWQPFEIRFETGADQLWMDAISFIVAGSGSAWLKDLSLREAAGGPELLGEADVSRPQRGHYNPIDCHMLDQIVAAAARHGIYLQLCLIARDLYMRDLKDPESPAYEQAIRDAQRLLRYAVARWGYSPQVVTWEYFNENDPGLPTDRFYGELGTYLETIDVYRHLRATSTWHPSPRDWKHPQLDVADLHFYLRPEKNRRFEDEVEAAVGQAALLREHAPGKPALISEFGLADLQWRATSEMRDSNSLADFHNGLWASALSGASGTAMFWWWERLDQKNAYPHYRPLSSFLADIPWTTARLQRIDAACQSDNPLRLVGLQNNRQAYFWLFDPRASFESTVIRQTTVESIRGATVEIRGMEPGSYAIQWWDTWQGGMIRQQLLTIDGGVPRVDVPEFQRDVACKILPAQ
ncbi:MAG: hypothetical protein FJ276_28865 [Planctomycetes bacterium]|nr:hypothetical protein [Planctomycetota bacterium]